MRTRFVLPCAVVPAVAETSQIGVPLRFVPLVKIQSAENAVTLVRKAECFVLAAETAYWKYAGDCWILVLVHTPTEFHCESLYMT